MNTDHKNDIPGNWKNQKMKLKIAYPVLTDADLHYEAGKRDEMLNRIQTILGKTRQGITDIMASL